MGRIRSIKPEIIEDEVTGSLSHLEWRMFVSLFLIADDYGNLRGGLDYVVGATLWASRDPRETLAKALETLVRVSLVCRYKVRGQTYLHINGWSKHQKVDKPGKPHMPGPFDDNAVILGGKREPSEDRRETLDESSRDSRETLDIDLRSPTSDPDLLPTSTLPEGSSGIARHVVTPEQDPESVPVVEANGHPVQTPPETPNVQHRSSQRVPGPYARPIPDPPHEAQTLAWSLLEYVVKNHDESKLARAPEHLRTTTAMKWGDEIRKLHALDGIPYVAIAAMIHWCQRESFWRTIVLSADGLRKNWDRMAAQRTRGSQTVPVLAKGDDKKRRAEMEKQRIEAHELAQAAARDRTEVRAALRESGLVAPDEIPADAEPEDIEPESVGGSQ